MRNLFTPAGFFVLFVTASMNPMLAFPAETTNAQSLKSELPLKRPNVLLIISDDLRDTLGCYGNPHVKTPNIDSLASRGLKFDRAYCQYSVCDPSRSSFLTGLRPEQTRVWDNSTFFRDKLPDVVTLPQAFRQDGYYTAGYGKVFHTRGGNEETQAKWSDSKNSWNDSHEAVPDPVGHKDSDSKQGDQHDPDTSKVPTIVEGRNLTGGMLSWCRWGATAGPDSLEPDYRTASAALAAMDKAEGKPWFIAAGFHRPHDPFIAPKKYFDMYPRESLKHYQDPPDMTPAPDLAIPRGDSYNAFQKFSDEDKREFTRAYYACTTFMDAQVGRLLDEITKRDLWKNTIVIFMGDNGYHLGERNWWNKVTVFERCARIPYIMAGEGIPSGQQCNVPVELVDLYPTLLDLCDVKPPENPKLAGQSLRPLIENPNGSGKEYAFTMVTRGKGNKTLIGRSVRTTHWRYTEWDEGREGIELYDESKDPEENHDLSQDPKYSDILVSLKKYFEKLPPVNMDEVKLISPKS
jgi:uncharacterized sulfatase